MYICIIDTIIACCTIQIITDGVNEERAQQGDQFQQGAESYHHDSFDQQGGDGDGFDKWDDEEEDWEAQQRQQDQDGTCSY